MSYLKREDIRVAVLRIEGTNCEQESLDSFKRLETQPEFVHLKQLLHIDCNSEEKRSLFDFDCIMIPGGFSAGDYIRAGAIFAARMKSKLGDDLRSYVEEERPILGICNGFQVLTELGLLPGTDTALSEIPQSCLTINDSARFECRPTLLKHENNGKCVFTSKISKGDIRLVPSAHAEGKLLFPKELEKKIYKELEDNDQIVFKYVDADGNYSGYPWNPNGSPNNIAGICNRSGTVFGMMPHPERSYFAYQHSDWTRKDVVEGFGDGQAVFESVVSYIEKKF